MAEKDVYPSGRLLVVDDTANIRDLLAEAFRARGLEVATATNGDDAINQIEDSRFDVVITDLRMPGKTGMDVLRAAKAKSVDTEVIVVTAYGDIDTAVEAMRLGALDFISKPFKLAEIERKVQRALASGGVEAQSPVRTPAAPKAVPGASRALIGESKATRQLLRMIQKVGPSMSSVLIMGPSGVGKELVAHAIHQASDRADRPFVALNCAALAPGVLESELFGHEKGAFTGATGLRVGRFEKAHRGTVFLDEVGEIDTHIQTKLLRVLQEGEIERVGGAAPIKVDTRIIAATNRDLRRAIAEGVFREDFYYRLNVFSLRVEPLRDRIEDIPPLVQYFVQRFSEETGKQVTSVDEEIMDLFMHYPWPGNVRELENVLERAVVLAEGDRVTMEEIPPEMLFLQEDAPRADYARPGSSAKAGSAPVAVAGETGSLVERTDQLESEMIYGALERFRWNKTKAAEHLGLKRTTLQYKIKKYGLE